MFKALFPLTTGTIVALLLTVPPAIAALDAPLAPPAASADGPDRALTRAEATTMAERLFERLDANRDGRIDGADRALRLAEMHAHREAEHAAELAARFDAMDTDRDGTISRAEFMAAHADRPGEPGAMMPPPPPPPMGPEAAPGLAIGYDAPGAPVSLGPAPRGAQRPMPEARPHHDWHPGSMPGAMMAGLILHTADPRHSGTVSHAAFIAAAQGLFDRADADHDGTVTPDERRAAAMALRADMRGRPDPRDDGPPPPLPPHD